MGIVELAYIEYITLKLLAMNKEETILVLNIIDESNSEVILSQPDLIKKLNYLSEKGLIEILDEEMLLTSIGRQFRETGEIEEIVSPKTSVETPSNGSRNKNSILKSLLKFKNPFLKDKANPKAY